MCVSFMHYINKVLMNHGADLDAYEDDAEVAALDAKAATKAAVVAEVSRFDEAPPQMQAMLISGVVAGLIASYALYFAPSRLFQVPTTTRRAIHRPTPTRPRNPKPPPTRTKGPMPETPHLGIAM